MSVTLGAAIEWARGRACMWRADGTGGGNDMAEHYEALADAAAGNLGADSSGLKVRRGEPVAIKREEAGMAASMDRAALEEAIEWATTELATFMAVPAHNIQMARKAHCLVAAARAHLATLPRTKMVEVWHVEFVSADTGAIYVNVHSTEEDAATEAAQRKIRKCLCVRVTGPHQHEVPA